VFWNQSHILYQLLNLSGDPENVDPSHLRGEALDDEFSLEIRAINSKMALFNENRNEMIIGYTYENWDIVRKTLPFFRKHEMANAGHFSVGFCYTWTAACHYDLYRAHGARKHKREGQRVHRKVEKWATTGTEMLSGPNKFLAAMESLCVRKAPLDEVDGMFEAACTACAESKCRYFEALANERLARLYFDEEPEETKGVKYLKRAIDLYRSWGALAKAEWLENNERYRPSLKCESSL
jgi:hypothetical protein